MRVPQHEFRRLRPRVQGRAPLVVGVPCSASRPWQEAAMRHVVGSKHFEEEL